MTKCLLISSCLLLSGGCPTPFNSGISGDTAVNTITGDDEKALCDAIEAEAEAEGAKEAGMKVGCYIAGSIAAAFVMDDTSPEEECQETYDDCMAGESSEEEEDSEDSCEFDFGDCAAPLADFETCTRSNWDELKTMADEMNCTQEEGDSEDSEEDSECTTSEACKAFYEACPSFDPCTD